MTISRKTFLSPLVDMFNYAPHPIKRKSHDRDFFLLHHNLFESNADTNSDGVHTKHINYGGHIVDNDDNKNININENKNKYHYVFTLIGIKQLVIDHTAIMVIT